MILRNPEEAAALGPTAVTIGNFDGVHLGHQALLRATVEAARERGLRAVAMIFDPHPMCIVAPQRAPRLLTSIEERCALLGDLGIDHVLVVPFTRGLSQLSPEQFAARFLRDTLHARVVLVGRRFHFGHKQAGNAAVLEALGAHLGYATQFVAEVVWRGRTVSASAVRKCVLGGDVATACRLLGRPHAVAGQIVRGHGIGSKQTVPTLNLRTEAQVLPARGVYITRTADFADGRRWPSLTNLGYRPTFGGDEQLSIETYLLDPLEGAAPAAIRLEFLRRLRDEKKFETAGGLKAQILLDARRARSYFRRLESFRRYTEGIRS
jgi:riboflavin kinase/FMN adenylyltransferase